MSEEEKELISSFESIVQGLEQYRNYDTIRGCIDCNDCSEKCYTIKEWEKIKNLIEKQQKEIENSVSVNKITKKIEEILRINRHKKKKDSEVEYAIDILKELKEEQIIYDKNI